VLSVHEFAVTVAVTRVAGNGKNEFREIDFPEFGF
jgi:hypothetical protein